MKYLSICLITVCFIGCSKPKHPPLEYMNEQSHLPLVNSDSVEYFKVREKDFWDWGQSYPFTTIIYFKNKDYKKILMHVKKDTNYYEIEDIEQIKKVFSVFFNKYIYPPPNCPMNNTIYDFNNTYKAMDHILVFCNCVYFRHANRTPFDDVPKRDKDE